MKTQNFYPGVALCAVLLCCLVGADSPDSAATKVRQGLQHFFGGKFEEAETSFDEASDLKPEEELIRFDKACASHAKGDFDVARGLFQSATLAKETSLAVKAHYNLGCLEADAAKVKLGEDPAAAVGEAREESIQLLLTAVRHHRDVLRLDSENTDARHNIELIRLFIKHIQSEWAERDKQKARDEKDLVQFVLMLEEKQDQFRVSTKTLQALKQDSPQRRQILMQSAESQRELQEEIPTLKEKIEQAFEDPQQQQQQPGSAPPAEPDERMQEMKNAMISMADDLNSQMSTAADAVQRASFDEAAKTHLETLNILNQLYMIAAPYDNILQRALKDQQQLAPQQTSQPSGGDATETAEETELTETSPDEVVTSEREVDFDEAVLDQGRITEWSRLLPLKAEAALPEVQQQITAMQAQMPEQDEELEADKPEEIPLSPDEQPEKTTEADVDDGSAEVDPAAAAAEQQKQQLEQLQGLAESMQRAVKLAPEAEEHSQAATSFLAAQDAVKAGPEQTETLQILKEIAEPLKQDPQENEDQNQDQQQEPQDDENDQDQQQEPQDDKNDQEQQQDQENSEQEQKKQQQQEAQQQQAESVLRQARERERDYREQLKEQQRMFGRAIKVDKDW